MTEITEFYNSMSSYISSLLLLISVAVSILAVYNRIKSNFINKITKFISDAEGEVELSGSEKMELVISWVKDIIPRLFKVIFTDKILKDIAENIFKDMRSYSDKYIHNMTGMEKTKVIEVVKAITDDSDTADE